MTDHRLSARNWLRNAGFLDAVVADADEPGVDVVGSAVVAVVRSTPGRATAVTYIQRIYGVGTLEEKKPFVFSCGHFTESASQWADRADVALLRVDKSGTRIMPTNAAAFIHASPTERDPTMAALEFLLADVQTNVPLLLEIRASAGPETGTVVILEFGTSKCLRCKSDIDDVALVTCPTCGGQLRVDTRRPWQVKIVGDADLVTEFVHERSECCTFQYTSARSLSSQHGTLEEARTCLSDVIRAVPFRVTDCDVRLRSEKLDSPTETLLEGVGVSRSHVVT